jgi:hypothetical protein
MSEDCIFQSSDPPLPLLWILSLEVESLAVHGDDERRIVLPFVIKSLLSKLSFRFLVEDK